MKLFWKDVLAGLIMGLVVPGILLNFAAILLQQPISAQEISMVSATTVPTEPVVTESLWKPMQMRLRKPDGNVVEADMDAYLVGVVLAEMPVWFEKEALKAQSVVARTYALKAYTTGGKHGDGSVCIQSGCCQAYIAESDYIGKGGDPQNIEKVRTAVEETSGYVLVYDGELIEATYFSCSGGSTEDAVAVWGTDYPYLRAVISPGEEDAAHYTDTVYFDPAEFCKALGIAPEGVPAQWIGTASHTAGGGIAEVVIGGRSFSGVQLRQLLGLRSTAISMTAEDSGITVTTKGFGHRVGMSQYGADAMAASGSTCAEILAHYYMGTTLVQWDKNTQSPAE